MAEILKAQSEDVEVNELKGGLGVSDDINRIRWEVQQALCCGYKVPASSAQDSNHYFHQLFP